MDKNDYITSSEKRKKGKHLTAEDRGAIQALKKEWFGIRAIARNIGCAPGTVINELRRGTPERKGSRGRTPGYSPKQGQAVYQANQSRCHRRRKADRCKPFIDWVTKQLREHKWSLDACVGYARKQKLFPAKAITEEAEYDRRIKEIYQEMLDGCQREIERFYGKYAAAEGITLAEAKKRVSKLDIAAYERKARKYVKKKDFSPKANEEMRLYNLTMKVNRLEMLKANLGLELISGHDELDKFLGGILQGRTEAELERQAGILGKTVRNNAQKAHAIVNASFHNATFSDRIWQYQNLMRHDLGKLLQTGLIQGKNPRALARDLEKYWYGNDPRTGKGAKYCMERLMRTELARVQTEAQKQSFLRNGFTMYEFICNFNGGAACPVCQGLNGKHFKVADMMPGENAPPMHPNCRCSCSAWEDDAEYEAWLDFLDKGGTTAEWERRKKGLENFPNGGTIISGATSGARNPYGQKAQEHAEKYYGLVRSMKTDVARIAKTTGFSEQEIQAIKDYIFYEKHDLGDGEPTLFDADYMMAESWQRLIDGKPEPHDLTLIRHELMERQLMEQGMSQYEAHIKTTGKYNYSKEAQEFYGKIEKYRN